MASRLRLGRLARQGWALGAAMLMGLAVAAPPVAATASSAATNAAVSRVVLDRGHVDFVYPEFRNAELSVKLREDVTGTGVIRRPEDVLLHVTDRAAQVVPSGLPPALNFLGPPGSVVHILPQAQDPQLLWPGWSTESPSLTSLSSPLRIALAEVDGPGEIHVWQTTGLGGVQSLLEEGGTRLPGTLSMRRGSHLHANWAFTQPGEYRVSVVASGFTTGGLAVSGQPVTYTFRVGPPPARFVAISPTRVLDTRGANRPLSAARPLDVDLSELIPVGTTAVAFNLTVTGQTSSGFAEVAPAGVTSGSSTINWSAPQQTIANAHVAAVSRSRAITISMGGRGEGHVVLDITGYFVDREVSLARQGAGLVAVNPQRLLDTRDGRGPLRAGQVHVISIREFAADVEDIAAVAVNVTVTGTQGSGFLGIADSTATSTSSINWSAAGQTLANALISPVNSEGEIAVIAGPANGDTHVVVDLVGLFQGPGAGDELRGYDLYSLSPIRSYDSRTTGGLLVGGSARTNTHPVPATATALLINTTVTGNSGSGFLTVAPPSVQTPTTSTINWFHPQTTRANGSIVSTSLGQTRAFVGGTHATHYLLDITGYFQ